jgi:hypothetical protein
MILPTTKWRCPLQPLAPVLAWLDFLGLAGWRVASESYDHPYLLFRATWYFALTTNILPQLVTQSQYVQFGTGNTSKSHHDHLTRQ